MEYEKATCKLCKEEFWKVKMVKLPEGGDVCLNCWQNYQNNNN